MPRQYINHSIDELEAFVQEHLRDRPVLAEIMEELEHRSTPRAKQLLKEVKGVLAGDVNPPRRPYRSDIPENQQGMFDE